MLKRVLILIISLFLSLQSWSTNDYLEGSFKEIRDLQELGAHFKAINNLENLSEKLEKKSLSIQNDKIRWNYLMATSMAGLGNFGKARDYFSKGLVIEKQINSENSPLEAEFKLLYGNYLLAMGQPGPASDAFARSLAIYREQLSFGDFSNQIRTTALKLLDAYLKNEQLRSFQSLYDSIYPIIKDRYAKKEIVISEKTGLKDTINVGSKDYRQRGIELVQIELLQRRKLILSGDYDRALAEIKAAHKGIKKMASKRSNQYVDHLINYAKCYEGKHDYLKAYKKWDDVVHIAERSKRSYADESAVVMDAFESMILTLLKNNQMTLAHDYVRLFENNMPKEFRYNNIYSQKLKYVDAIRKAIHGNWITAERELNELIRDSLIVPNLHKEHFKYLESAFFANMRNERFELAKKQAVLLPLKAKSTYGLQSPITTRAQMQYANFEIQQGESAKNIEEQMDSLYNKGVLQVWEATHTDFHEYQHIYLNYLDMLDRGKEALVHLDTIIEQMRSENHSGMTYVKQLNERARFEFTLGKYKAMQADIDSASVIYDEFKIEKSHAYANHLINKSRLFFIEGRFFAAENYFNSAIRAASRAERSEPFENLAHLEDELVELYIAVGDYSKAEKIAREEIEYFSINVGKNSHQLIGPYNNLAKIFILSGEFTEAESYNQMAIELSKKKYGQNSLRHTYSLAVQSKIYESKGDFDRSIQILEFILGRYKEILGKRHVRVAEMMAELALLRYNTGADPNKILAQFNEAAIIAFEDLGPKSPQYANIIKEKAFFFIREGQLDSAEILLNQAFAIWTELVGDKSLEAADIDMLRGELQVRKKNFAQAEEKYENAMRIYSNIFNKDHPKYVKVVSLMARVKFIDGDYKQCISYLDESMTKYLQFIEKFFPSLSEREKSKYWNLVKGDFEFFNSVAIKVYDENPRLIGDAYGYSLITKAILLNSSIKVRNAITSSGNPTLVKKYFEWVEKKELLVRAIGMSPEKLEEAGMDLNLLKVNVELLEKEISLMSDAFSKTLTGQQFDWKDVRNTLDEGEAAVEIIRFRKFHEDFTDTIIYAALVIRDKQKNAPELVLFENGAEMEGKSFKRYKNSIKFKLKDEVSYSAYWEPINKLLENSNKVYLSVDGIYNQINIETLKKGDGNFVIDDKQIALLSNTKELVTKKGRLALNTDNRAVLFGNPNFHKESGSWPDLDGAENEVKEISNYLESQGWVCEMRTESRATEEAIKNLKSPKVFHIATHGFFVEDENESANDALENLGLEQKFDNTLLKSGLVMNSGGDIYDEENPINFNKQDGLLTAYEAMNLNLDQTDMVVLSACETGLGEVAVGEGVYGLQRSLLVAGARTVVMSLFKVSDEATQKLMLKFYQNWQGGMDKRLAFVEAKRFMKKEFPDPLFWGAFVMIGYD